MRLIPVFKESNRLLTAILILACSLFALGILFEAPHPVLGMLAGNASGVLFTALVSVLAIQKILDLQRKEEWSGIRKMTYNAIIYHICFMAIFISVSFGELSGDKRKKLEEYAKIIKRGINSPNVETANALQELSSHLYFLFAEENKTNADGLTDWRTNAEQFWLYHIYMISWRLENIRTILTPRVLIYPGNKKMCEALTNFDNIQLKYEDILRDWRSKWEESLSREQDKHPLPEKMSFFRPAHLQEFAELLYMGSIVYRAITEDLQAKKDCL